MAAAVLAVSGADAGGGAIRIGSTGATRPDWAGIVGRIRAGESDAIGDLYRAVEPSLRAAIRRQVFPQDVTDVLHGLILSIVESIRAGKLRDPERLPGYLWAAVRGQVAKYIRSAVHVRCACVPVEGGLQIPTSEATPEQRLIRRQRSELALQVLRSISARDREVLVRFYLREQTPEEICADMRLSETQFRLIKSRAKARLSETGRRAASSNALEDAVPVGKAEPIGDRLTVCDMKPRDWRSFADSLPREHECDGLQRDLKYFAWGYGWHTPEGFPDGESGCEYHRRIWDALAGGPYQVGPYRVERFGKEIAFVITPQHAEQRRLRCRGPKRPADAITAS